MKTTKLGVIFKPKEGFSCLINIIVSFIYAKLQPKHRLFRLAKNAAAFCMARVNRENLHECFPKHSLREMAYINFHYYCSV